jgi:trans-aconitate methyltransferase
MEWQLFTDADGIPPLMTTAGWYEDRDRAPHLEQAGHRSRLLAASRLACVAGHDLGAETLVDLGAGDGGLLQLLGERCPELTTWGYDLSPANVHGAQWERRVDVTLADFTTMLAHPLGADMAVMTEVLEHLWQPHLVAAWVRTWAKVLICSSPAYETATSHDGVHLWAWDMAGYRAMIEGAGWEVIDHFTVGPFQLAGCR